jgi:hypothetical protein
MGITMTQIWMLSIAESTCSETSRFLASLESLRWINLVVQGNLQSKICNVLSNLGYSKASRFTVWRKILQRTKMCNLSTCLQTEAWCNESSKLIISEGEWQMVEATDLPRASFPTGLMTLWAEIASKPIVGSCTNSVIFRDHEKSYIKETDLWVFHQLSCNRSFLSQFERDSSKHRISNDLSATFSIPSGFFSSWVHSLINASVGASQSGTEMNDFFFDSLSENDVAPPVQHNLPMQK